MSKLEKALFEDIPLADGASFFIRVKTSGWNKPQEATSKEAAITDRFLNRAGELLKGTKARELLRQSAVPHAEAIGTAAKALKHHGMGQSVSDLGPTYVPKVKQLLDESRQYGDQALKEYKKVDASRAAALGLGAGALGGASTYIQEKRMDPEERQEILDKGGPITDWSMKHPAIAGAVPGAVAWGSMPYLFKMDPFSRRTVAETVAAGLAASFGPSLALGIADKLLKDKDGGEDKTAASDSVEDLKEKGKERAITNMAAEAYREKARRGERAGGLVGSVAGMGTGARLSKYLKSPHGRVIGAGLGYLAGGKAGKEVGTEVDIKKNASARFLQGLQKLGYGEDMQTMGQPMQQEPMPPNAATPEPIPEPPAPPAQTMDMEPVHYLAAEQIGREAEQENEASYYRGRMHEALQQLQQMGQQVSEVQQQASMAEQQAMEATNQVSERTQQAVEANMEATNQAQQAASMRIGLEKLRRQMMEVASQDPEQLAAPDMGAMDPAMADPAMQDPMMAEGPAAQAPGAELAPGSAPAGAGGPGTGQEPQNADGGAVAPEMAEPTLKTGAAKEELLKRAPWLVAGGGLGAMSGLAAAKKAPGLRDQVEELSGSRSAGDFQGAKRLSDTYKELGEAEKAEVSPARAALAGGIGGAAFLGSMGPKMVGEVKRLVKNLQEVRRGTPQASTPIAGLLNPKPHLN